ncbi:MAG: hypothetical protein ACI81C_002762 [Alteromonas macleodii]|jgi:hypothetical protein
MKTGYCPKCGSTCEITFARYVTVNGKVRYPKKASVFVIPLCKCKDRK